MELQDNKGSRIHGNTFIYDFLPRSEIIWPPNSNSHEKELKNPLPKSYEVKDSNCISRPLGHTWVGRQQPSDCTTGPRSPLRVSVGRLFFSNIAIQLLTSKLLCFSTRISSRAIDLPYSSKDMPKKACELGTKYSELAKEKTELALDLEASKNRLERAQTELKTLGDTMKKELEDKDKALAAAQKMAKEKTEAAKNKLAVAKKLEEGNARLKQEKIEYIQKFEQLTKRKVMLEKFFEDYTKKMFTMLDEFCQNFEKETEELEPNLEPTKSPTGDAVAMNIFRLESRLRSVQGYISRLKAALGKMDKELWPEDTLQVDLKSMMTRLHEIPSRVQAWKKSAACCGAHVALSLVRVHCKEAREDKLKDLRVMNTKKLQFEDFMETFIEAATRIVDGIDLDTFVKPASPSGA